MNILILSCGTRNKVVQHFRHAVGANGRIVATDMSPYAPALYEANQKYVVPRITEPGYIELVLEICRKEKIDGVLSLIDPELALLAQNESRFTEVGARIIGSSYELCERAMNKMEMYHWLTAHGYLCAKSYTDKETFLSDAAAGTMRYPVFVKPVRGSASIAVSKVYDPETVELLFAHSDGLMIQEYLDGQEIGADVYIDMVSGEVVSIFTKKKLVMRAGETDKAVSFKNAKLFDLIERFAKESGWRGQIDIDLFEVNGEYYISEVNPRFGGGYPHAYACGVDHMAMIVENLAGRANEPAIGAYKEGIVMMKYSEIKVCNYE